MRLSDDQFRSKYGNGEMRMTTPVATEAHIIFASDTLGDFNVRHARKGGIPAIWRFAKTADAVVFSLRFEDAKPMGGE